MSGGADYSINDLVNVGKRTSIVNRRVRNASFWVNTILITEPIINENMPPGTGGGALMRIMILIVSCLFMIHSNAWQNGQSGNAATDDAGECDSPPYSTHDWVPVPYNITWAIRISSIQ